MGYSPYAHIGFGVTIKEELYEEIYKEIVEDETGECKNPGLTLSFSGDSRGGPLLYVLVLSETYVECHSYEVKPFNNDTPLSYILHQRFKECLKDIYIELEREPTWLIWGSII